MIQINNLEKSFAGHALFKGITFQVGKGDKIGLVGRNGSGKTTLFKLILGEETEDGGHVVIPKNYRIATLRQHINFKEKTLIRECQQKLRGDQQYDLYRAEKILMGLGFTPEDFNRPPQEFSGGQQLRIHLCLALLEDPNLLLLDEPTNYLDIVGLRWLKGYLKSFSGEVLLITHDRSFMDEVTTHTMGIHRQKLRKVPGGTEKYYEQIALEEEVHEKTRLNQEKKRVEMERFVDRFRAKASKASAAQSKLKALSKMDNFEKLSSIPTLNLAFNYKEIQAKKLMTVEDLNFHYPDNNLNLIEKLSFTVGSNDRIAIIGKNGKGKSTLLNLLAGELSPTRGEVSSHPGLVTGHFGQTNVQRLTLENTIEKEINNCNTDLSIQNVRSICGAMMFSGDHAEKQIKVLSGGERARVLLGKILAAKCNLLLLDEPTNHLDMESVETLVQSINNFPGAVVLVTHNEMILHAVADHIIVFHRDRVEYLPGNYQYFLDKVGWEDEDNPAKESTPSPKINRKELKRLRSQLIGERSKELGPLKSEIEQIEESITIKEAELERNNRELISASESGDGEKINSTSKNISELEAEINNLFEKLEHLTHFYEERESYYNQELEKLES